MTHRKPLHPLESTPHRPFIILPPTKPENSQRRAVENKWERAASTKLLKHAHAKTRDLRSRRIRPNHFWERPHPCKCSAPTQTIQNCLGYVTPKASVGLFKIIVRMRFPFCKIVAKTKINKVASLKRP